MLFARLMNCIQIVETIFRMIIRCTLKTAGVAIEVK